MQFALQVSPNPDEPDKRSVIRAHDQVQVTPCLPTKWAERVRHALTEADAELDQYLPPAIFCMTDLPGSLRARELCQANREKLMATLRRVMPEAFERPQTGI